MTIEASSEDRAKNRSGPVIAVVIAARNVEQFIAETLQSVFDQTLANFELVVVLDRSTDRTTERVNAFAEDSRMRIVASECRGVSDARNVGLGLISAPFVVFLDGDDIMAADALKAFLSCFSENPEALAVVGAHVKIDEAGQPIEGEGAEDRPGFGPDRALEQLLRRNTIVNGGAIAMRSDIVRAVGGFDVDLRQGEDWELWCRVACRGEFATLGQRPVLYYRQRRSSATALVTVEVRPDDPAIDKIFAIGEAHSRLSPAELSRLHRTATISSFWARARTALYQGQKWQFVRLMAIGLWRYPDSLFQGFLLKFLARKVRSRLGPGPVAGAR
ncbi:MAG: glycosyltransferase [Geminicoccaceae bacterium]